MLPSERSFTSWLRSPAVAARVGVWLGVCFGVAFVTGLVSHWAQSHVWWVPYPTAPSWGYRVTQGLHVAAGTAAIPLLLVKLWTVFPRLLQHLPRAGVRVLLLHALERGSIAVLVAAAIFQLATGLANSAQWYPWSFSFRATHYAIAWVAIGALVVHVAVKLPVIRQALAHDVDDDSLDRPGTRPPLQDALGRRALLRTTWAAAALAVVATVGATLTPLRRLSVLGVRDGTGPQALPVNTSARTAAVTALALRDDYALTVEHAGRTVRLSLADLEDMDQHTERLPIACVEGWSAQGSWTGVSIRDLLDLVEAPSRSSVVVRSLQPDGPYRATLLQGAFTDDHRTLVALRLGGERLALDHGYPARLIAPNRPGVLQTKWIHRIEVKG